MKRKDRTAEKRQPIPKRFSGDGSAPPRLSVWFSALFLLPFRGVCLAAARVSAAHLSMPSTRHGAKEVFASFYLTSNVLQVIISKKSYTNYT